MAATGEYIYKRLYDYYGGQQLPADNTGVFFSTSNFTRPRLIECIEYLQDNYGAGWFTDDSVQRMSVLRTLANDLHARFDTSIDTNKIYKFLCWVYSYAKNDEPAQNYFKSGVSYGPISYYTDKIADTVTSKASSAADTVSYGLNVPTISSNTLTKSLENTRTILKLLPVAAIAALVGYAILTDKK